MQLAWTLNRFTQNSSLIDLYTSMKCNICGTPSSAPIFESTSESSITSLCELRSLKTKVWFCENCLQLQSPAMVDNIEYYAEDYRILLNHEEEDQIYEAFEDAIVYRTDHQTNVLKQKVDLSKLERVLDYGCAKSSMTKKLAATSPTTIFSLFDVSDMYVEYWKKLPSISGWAINETPAEWSNSFDMVTSYFSMEHIPAPVPAVEHIYSLLKEGGLFYGVVPNVLTNRADFIVVDHVNHFTESSLTVLLGNAGFGDIDIDSGSHRGALVFTARKNGTKASGLEISRIREDVKDVANFWANLNKNIRKAEESAVAPFAIYGSGFYGAYIYSALAKKNHVKCFIDRSPFQQGKRIFDVTVIAPEMIPEDVKSVFVGLNPDIALKVVSGLPKMYDGLDFHYLK